MAWHHEWTLYDSTDQRGLRASVPFYLEFLSRGFDRAAYGVVISEMVFLLHGRRKWFVTKNAFDTLSALGIQDEKTLAIGELLFPYESFALVFERGCMIGGRELRWLRAFVPGRGLAHDIMPMLGLWDSSEKVRIRYRLCVVIDWGLPGELETIHVPDTADNLVGAAQHPATLAALRLLANALLVAENVPDALVPMKLGKEKDIIPGGRAFAHGHFQLLPDVKRLYEHASSSAPGDGEKCFHMRRMHWRVYRDARFYSKIPGARRLDNGNWAQANGIPLKRLIAETEERPDLKQL